jgi:HK97 family phage major capsid protein
MTQEELDQIGKEAAKVENKMNSLVDPLIKRLEAAEQLTPELKAELKATADKYAKMQEHLDALDLKLQKANVPDQDAPLYDQIKHIVDKTDWIKGFKESKRGGKIDLKGVDLMSVKVGTVTRVADTIQPQFTSFQFVPGRKLHIRDLLPVGTTTSSTIWMPYESATTNGIARVAEGALKPQSDFTPAVTKWAIEKIATWIKFSEEILEDMPMFTSYLTTRWLELLKQAEDNKLLYGTGSSDIKGLTVAAAAYSDVLASAAVDRWMVLDAAVTQCQVANWNPNVILLHPTDAMKLRQTRSTTYEFINRPDGSPIVINGATVVISPAITAGDFLVGDFGMGAQIWDRKSANITMYDQNEDDAKYNLILAVIEERLALVTYQSTAFVFGDFISALAKGSA